MTFRQYFQTLATGTIGTTDSETNNNVTRKPEAAPARSQFRGRNPFSLAENSGIANIVR